METLQIGSTRLRVVRGDITELEVDAFVHDIGDDLRLQAGFGSAIQQRGGIAIQKELDAIGACPKGEAIVTDAGLLKATYIIHANGPKFREEDEEGKLASAVRSALARAEEKGVKRLALPPIGTGLYQVPLDLCVRVMLDTITAHLENGSTLDEVVLVAADSRELKPFEARLIKGA